MRPQQRNIRTLTATAVLAASALLVAGCSSSGSAQSQSQSATPTQSSTSGGASSARPVNIAPNDLRCASAPATEIATIKTALRHSAHDLTNGVSVTIRPGAAIVAARLAGSPNDDIGTWFYSSGEIEAIDIAARTYSYWGSATEPGSDAAKQRDVLLASPAEAKAIKCVSGLRTGKPTSQPRITTAQAPPARPAPVPTTSTAAQCTQTSTGSCIRGGEFCRQAQYGQQGTDAEGRTYTCTGSQKHPHWE